MTKSVYKNEVLRETVVTDNLLTGMSIGTLQEDFLLCEADFLRLKGEGSAFVTWSLNVLYATVGYAMSILPKWISELVGKPEKVSQGEWTTFAIGLAIFFGLFLLSMAVPNEKKELLNRISQHFKSAPKSRQLVRGQQ